MIRPYTPNDRNDLINLIKLNIPRYFDRTEESDFIEYLDQHLEDYFVLEIDGKIIGCGGVNYFRTERSARISWDIIHPDFHGKGLGRQLTQHRINLVKKDPSLDLLVVRTTQLVYPFYEKLGFSLEKVEKDFWAEGFDLYQMTMDL